ATPSTVDFLTERLRDKPNDLVALLRLGNINERQGAVQEAKSAYERALALNPKAAPVLIKLAELSLTSLNDPKQSSDYAQRARALAPNDPQIASVLGRLALRSKDDKWSVSLLREATRKPPVSPDLLFELAHAEFNLGHLRESRASIDTALARGTN